MSGPIALRWDDATLHLDEHGRLVGLTHDQWGSYLDAWQVHIPTSGPAEGPSLLVVDDDEVEVQHQSATARVTIRHSVVGPRGVGQWNTRIVVENTSGARAHHAPQIDLTPARGCAGWMWSAGSEAVWIIAAATVDDAHTGAWPPLLVVRQRSGTTRDTDALVLGPDQPWAAGERRVWQWNAAWVPDFRSLADVLPPWWPATTHLPDGVPLELWDMDLAVAQDTSEELTVITTDHGTDVEPATGRRAHHLHLHHHRGTTVVEVRWAPGVETVAQRCAGAAVQRHASRGGSRMSAQEAALILAVLAGPGLPDPMGALDVVEAAMAHLLAAPPDAALVLTCVGLHDATGESAWLDQAEHVMAQLGMGPLVATAGLNLLTACVTAGRSPEPAAESLARLAAWAARGHDGQGEPVEVSIRAEFALVASAGRWDHRIREAAAWAGARLGGGMPGRPLPAIAEEEVARLAMMLGHADESGARELADSWLCGPGELVEHTRRGLLAGLWDQLDGTGGAPGCDTAHAARVLLPLVLTQSV